MIAFAGFSRAGRASVGAPSASGDSAPATDSDRGGHGNRDAQMPTGDNSKSFALLIQRFSGIDLEPGEPERVEDHRRGRDVARRQGQQPVGHARVQQLAGGPRPHRLIEQHRPVGIAHVEADAAASPRDLDDVRRPVRRREAVEGPAVLRPGDEPAGIDVVRAPAGELDVLFTARPTTRPCRARTARRRWRDCSDRCSRPR